ncbi:hypothetical protein BDV93DRAFT_593912, partial [Ceratobasidium sp. AG-I]
PTLSALILPSRAPNGFSSVLAIGQDVTSGPPPLPGTISELDEIQRKPQGHILSQVDRVLEIPAAVLAGMEQHSWVRLACHAKRDPATPLWSAFYLHGGTLDLATITQKQLKNAGMVFSSACQAATGDESFSQETIHLAAGMFMAGYKTVVATTWSIGDEDAPRIAEKVCKRLLEGCVPDSRRAAVAVHKSVRWVSYLLNFVKLIVPKIHSQPINHFTLAYIWLFNVTSLNFYVPSTDEYI